MQCDRICIESISLGGRFTKYTGATFDNVPGQSSICKLIVRKITKNMGDTRKICSGGSNRSDGEYKAVPLCKLDLSAKEKFRYTYL